MSCGARKKEGAKSLIDRLCEHSLTSDITTYQEIKDIILTKSVRAKLLFVVGAGLPYSGTSSLIRGILNVPESKSLSLRNLTTFSTVFFKDSVKCDGHFVVFDQDTQNDGMLLIALTKLLKTKQFKITMGALQDSGSLFLNEEVNEYFKQFCNKLQGFVKDISECSGNDPLVAITKSQSFINFLDITVNKAIYECLFIVGSWCRNGFLLSVLNLCYYSLHVLKEKLDLSQPHFPKRRYHDEDISLLKMNSACHFFLSIFEGTFSKKNDGNRAMVVYTHQDELDREVFEARMREVTQFIKKSLINSNLSVNSFSSYLAISNTQGNDQFKEVLHELISLIENSLGHDNYVHLKDMFFYSYLKSKNKMYLLQDEVVDFGNNCGMSEIEVCTSLQLLHDSCFIFKMKGIIIFDLTSFIAGVSKLYYIRSNRKEDSFQDIDHEFLSRSTLALLWGELSNLYINTLQEAGLMTEIHCSSSFDFFMPSLRTSYEEEKVNHTTTSLLILSDTTIIPFHMQCLFMKLFQESYDQSLQILRSKMYNVLQVRLDQQVKVKLFFCEKFLELSVQFKESHDIQDEIEIYSKLKSVCADVLNLIRDDKKCGKFEPGDISSFGYSFAVCCPQTSQNKHHYITFQDSVRGHFWCSVCKDNISIKDERRHWLTSLCERTTLHPNDHLNYDNIGKVTQLLLNGTTSDEFHKICDFMDDINKDKLKGSDGAVEYDADKPHDRLFHSLYSWHILNKSHSKIYLAKLLHENEFKKEAFIVEPLLKKWLALEPTYIPLTETEITKFAESWKEGYQDLAKLIKVDPPASPAPEVPDQEHCIEVIKRWSTRNPIEHQYRILSKIIGN